MRATWVIVLGLLATGEVASAKCAMPSVGSAVITPAGTTTDADGGVLVGTVNDWERLTGGADNAVNPTWRFTDGTKHYEPVLVTLAPGLVVYRPPVGVTGALGLMDANTQRGKVAITSDKVALLAAPDPKKVVLNKVSERYGGFRYQIDATFKSAVPAGAVAIVLFSVTKKGNVARSWTRVEAAATTAQVAGSSGRCDPGVPGEIMSKVGDKIVLAWVDAGGRLSKTSKMSVVHRGK